MDASLLELFHQHGYLALFLAVWIGIWVAPIPDEAVVLSVGMASARGVVGAVPGFVLTYAAMVSALSLGYVVGRVVGAPIVDRLASRPRLLRPLARARKLLAERGSVALALSYALPVVRILVPHLVGAGRMPFGRFAVYSYSAGFVWTLAYFLAGRTMGHHADEILGVTTPAARAALAAVAIGAVVSLRLYGAAVRIHAAKR